MKIASLESLRADAWPRTFDSRAGSWRLVAGPSTRLPQD